jgi:ATP-dependent Clp protease protease subunit
MDLLKDFRKFAIDKTNVKATVFDDQVKKSQNFLTPYILEERKLNVSQLDVFSRLLFDRIIYFTGEVTADACDTINAELLYLDSVDNRDISIYINSGGGEVVSGLSVIDTMNFIKSDVSTICMGMSASMASVLLSNGKKGKRFVLPHSRVMIHSVSSGFQGHTADIKIQMEQTERCQKDVYEVLSQNTGFSYEEMEKMCDRDKWFIGQEAVDELHIADKVIDTNKKDE